MDKNTILGFVLIAAVVIGFSVLNKPSEEQLAQRQHYQDSIRLAKEQQAILEAQVEEKAAKQNADESKTASVNNFFQASAIVNDSITSDSISSPAREISEQIVSLENEVIKVDFSTKGGQMVRAALKDFQTHTGDSLYLFDNDATLALMLENKSSVKLNTLEASFKPVKSDDSSLTMRLNYSDKQYIDFVYVLEPNSYMVKFDIHVVGMDDVLSRTSKEEFVLEWDQSLRRQEKSLQNEQRYSKIYYKNAGQDVHELSESKNQKEEISDPVKWVAFKDQYFASTIIADYSFNTSVLDSKVLEANENYLKLYKASLYITPTLENDGSLHAGFKYFLGPLNYSMLKSYDDNVKDSLHSLDLDKMVPLGWTLFRWINQYLVIPLFNLLSTSGLSMGIIILLLTVIIKIIIAPLTYKSYMSSAKMRVLRPQVEEINEKYPKQEQAMERQRATMELYNKAGANPMSGCLPMLLQFPILAALFMFFPSAIELRHQSFLWASDLSTYDAIIEWQGNIPLVSKWLGNHISLFCLLMTATNIVYTKFNMDATNTGQQQMPGMKWMMMLMPLIFFFVLNNYPSGLTYYYFISTLITILLTLSFRFLIDEKKLLAKLEANKNKPRKKSGFMARLEEAQRMQQQQAKGKSNPKKKR